MRVACGGGGGDVRAHSLQSVDSQRHMVARVPRDIKYEILRTDLRERRFRYVRARREYDLRLAHMLEIAAKRQLAEKVSDLLRGKDRQVRVRRAGVGCAGDSRRGAAALTCATTYACGCGHRFRHQDTPSAADTRDGEFSGGAWGAEGGAYIPQRPVFTVIIPERAMRALIEQGLERMHSLSVGWVAPTSASMLR